MEIQSLAPKRQSSANRRAARRQYVKGTPEYNRRLNPYVPMSRSYNFVNKDPHLESVIRLVEADNDKIAHLAERSGLSPNTIRRLVEGRTIRAQHLTYVKLLDALGYAMEIMRKPLA